MKYVSVLLVGLMLGGCAHDQETAAMFGLLIGAAIVSATLDEEDRDRGDRRHHRRHEHWRDNDRDGRNYGGGGGGRRRYQH